MLTSSVDHCLQFRKLWRAWYFCHTSTVKGRKVVKMTCVIVLGGGGMLGLRTVEREILTDNLPCISGSKINDLWSTQYKSPKCGWFVNIGTSESFHVKSALTMSECLNRHYTCMWCESQFCVCWFDMRHKTPWDTMGCNKTPWDTMRQYGMQ